MPRSVTLYGLKSCDSCRAARTALSSAGVDVKFVDLRATPPAPAFLDRLLDACGQAAINRRSTTWRQLADSDRAASPRDLLTAHPALIKRPVIERADGTLSVGWTPDIARALGV